MLKYDRDSWVEPKDLTPKTAAMWAEHVSYTVSYAMEYEHATQWYLDRSINLMEWFANKYAKLRIKGEL